MMWLSNGPGWGGWITMTAGMLVFWTLVLSAIIALVWGVGADRSPWPRGSKHEDPLRLLDERLARDQIDLADYLGRCALLSKPGSLVTGHLWPTKRSSRLRAATMRSLGGRTVLPWRLCGPTPERTPAS